MPRRGAGSLESEVGVAAAMRCSRLPAKNGPVGVMVRCKGWGWGPASRLPAALRGGRMGRAAVPGFWLCARLEAGGAAAQAGRMMDGIGQK